jgi:hypothetical protein
VAGEGRSGEGKTSPRRVQVALRRAKVLQMRAAGASPAQILAAFPDDYKTEAAVYQDIQRALLSVVREPAAELKALENARLDMLWVKGMQVLSRSHVTVSHGKIVYVTTATPDGGIQETPLQDDGPVLAAIRELRRLSESRRKLNGLDAPTQVQVINDDLLDAEIRRLTEELGRAEARQAADAEDPEGAES